MENILECRGISKCFKSNSELTPVLKGVSFSVRRSSFVAITGKSGAGKTTLLGILNGSLRPDSGEVIIDGQCISSLCEKGRADFRLKNLGLVFQDNNLVDNFTVYENIALPLFGIRKKPDKEKISSLCAELGIEGFLGRYPSELSGGQQQRVAIARSLIIDPLIIFIDEPTGSLDAVVEKEVLGIFQKINRVRGVTIVAVTHSENLIAIADKHLRLEEINKA
jgi:ABC-type lipoprotein export system ATPase subunit